EFLFAGISPGEYEIDLSSPGFNLVRRKFVLQPRDRAVISAQLQVGSVTEAVEVQAANQIVRGGFAIGGGVGAGAVNELAVNGRIVLDQAMLAAPMAAPAPMKAMATNGALLTKDERKERDKPDGPSAHVRSYFPEALYINPEIITDKSGSASITIPIADS